MLELLTSVVASDTLPTATKQWTHCGSMKILQNVGEQTSLPIFMKGKESELDSGVHCGSQCVIIIFWCLFSAHLCPGCKISVCYCLSRRMFYCIIYIWFQKILKIQSEVYFCVYMYSCLWITFCWITAIICIYQWIFFIVLLQIHVPKNAIALTFFWISGFVISKYLADIMPWTEWT